VGYPTGRQDDSIGYAYGQERPARLLANTTSSERWGRSKKLPTATPHITSRRGNGLSVLRLSDSTNTTTRCIIHTFHTITISLLLFLFFQVVRKQIPTISPALRSAILRFRIATKRNYLAELKKLTEANFKKLGNKQWDGESFKKLCNKHSDGESFKKLCNNQTARVSKSYVTNNQTARVSKRYVTNNQTARVSKS
jgi:hypothetical protein